MNKQILAAIYVVPVAFMSVYGRPFFGDFCAFAIIVIYLSLPFILVKYLRNKDKAD